MAQRLDQSTAYVQPAESLHRPAETEAATTMELTPVEAMHSVWAGIGTFLAVFAVRCLLAGQWVAAYAVGALLWGLFVCGCLLIVRYVFDLGAILKNQFVTIRNLQGSFSAMESTIYSLKNLCYTLKAQVATLERDKAMLQGKINGAGRSQSYTPPVDVYGDVPTDEQVAEHRQHLEQAYSQPIQPEPLPVAPDDQTAREMALAMKILECAFDAGTDSIARDSVVKPRTNMTTADWQKGRDFLMQQGVVGERPPRGYELIVDAQDAITALRRRIDARADAKAAGMVGA